MLVVVGRRIPSSTRSKLYTYTKSNGLVATSYSVMQSSQSDLSTDNTSSSDPPKLLASEIFSEENKRRTIDLLSTDRDNFYFDFARYGKSCRKAAVLVPLCVDQEGRPGLLMNLRSETLHTHGGEISFPGGTFEPPDQNDPVTAALRETEEELGLKPEDVEIWTTIRVFPTVSTKLGVYPVVGFIKSNPLNLDTLVINPDEVDHAFILPLAHLCRKKNWADMLPPTKISGRSFRIPTYRNLQEISPGLAGIPLWGLTAFMTHLLMCALVPEHYHRKVPFIELVTTPSQQQGNSPGPSAITKDKNKTKPEPSSNSKL